ncbi:MAG: DUF1801 domain-containing protein [Bacteroidota bacterium]
MSATTKKTKLTGAAQVAGFLKTLDYPLKNVVEAVRAIILSANPGITEHIKWNAPSFCFGGEDRITMNLRSEEFLQLIFHRGAKVKNDAMEFEDTMDLLVWLSHDRATVKFADMDEVAFKKDTLAEITNRWVNIA